MALDPMDDPFADWRRLLRRRLADKVWSMAQLADEIAALTDAPRPPTETVRAFVKGTHIFPRAAFRAQLRAYFRRLQEIEQ